MTNESEENCVYLNKDEILAQEGDLCTTMYWLKHGKLEVFHNVDQETQEHIRYIRPGQLVGEIAFIDQLPRTATIKAVEHSLVVALEYHIFKDMMDRQEPWIKAIIETLAHRVRSDTLMLKNKDRCPHCFKRLTTKP